ncbi:LysR substrate-binding domain-containing protein [Curvibacter sp. APW13]|uniref:LysR substrate-binding domain-containing protein n=1 Tax=Curvibacter sp. APW13 TaxID=3077236 RepID=UPI0028DDCFDA|nr:LysR substrate-binding domain-containing protein [Curvibacter sp. APW13]MDT8990527.1 LysR substrate-binding domain-containing protein [Curvibacter sp. APW13]
MTRRTLPPLNAVRAFEVAARLGSFVAASQELHVTQPAIGRHVKALEDNLGTSLFERTPRGVVLTTAGQHYFEQVSAALQAIAEASVDLRTRARKPSLRLVVVPGFASRWLRPRLAAFRQLHPGVRISVEFNAGFGDPAEHRADLGIGYGEPEEYSGTVETLVRPAIFPVCSPAFLAGLEKPLRHASELPRLPLLHEDDGTWWGQWLKACGVRAKAHAELTYDSADQVIAEAVAGEGVALCNEYLVAQELRDGRLVRPLPDAPALQAYVLVFPPATASPITRSFTHWLREALAR